MKQVVKESVERIDDKLQTMFESFDSAMSQVFGVELTEKKTKTKENVEPENIESDEDPKANEKKSKDEPKTDEKSSEKAEKEVEKDEDVKSAKKKDKKDETESEEKEKEEKNEKKDKEDEEDEKDDKKPVKENLVNSGDAKGADVFKTGEGKNLSDSGLSVLSKGENKKKPKGKAGYEKVEGPSGETYDKVYTNNKEKDNETVPGKEGNAGTPVKEGYFKTQKMDRASMKQKVLLTKYTKDDEGHATSEDEGFEQGDKASGETYDKSAKDNTKKSDEGPRDEKGSLEKDANMGSKEKPKFGDALKDKKKNFPSKVQRSKPESGSVGTKESGSADNTEFYKK